MSTNVPILGATVKFDADLKLFTDKVSEVRSVIDGLAGKGAKIIPIDPASVENTKAAASAIAKMTPAMDEASAAADKMQKMMDKIRFKLDLEGFKGEDLERALKRIEEAEMQVAGTAGTMASKIIAVSRQQQAAYVQQATVVEKLAEAQRAAQQAEAERIERLKSGQDAVTRLLQREKEQREANAAAAKARASAPAATVDTSIMARDTKEATEVLARAQKQAARFKEDIRGAAEELNLLRKRADDAGVGAKSSFLEAERALQKIEKEYEKLVSASDKNRGKIAKSIEEGFDVVASKIIKTEEKIESAIQKTKATQEKATKTVKVDAADSASALDSVLGKWIGIGAAVKTASEAAEFAINVFRGAAERAFNIFRESKKFEIGVGTLQTLSTVAQETGLSLSELGNSIRYMETNIGKAQSGIKLSVANLALLGFAANDLKGFAPEEQLAMIAERFSGIEDPSRRAEVAMGIFGRQGANMIPVLALGGEGLREMSKKAKELGSNLDESTLKGLKDAEVGLTDMQIAFRNLGSNLSSVVAGPITDGVKALTHFAAASTEATKAWQTFGQVKGLSGSMIASLDAITQVATFSGTFREMFSQMPAGFNDLGDRLAAQERARKEMAASAGKEQKTAQQSVIESINKEIAAEEALAKKREEYATRKGGATAQGEYQDRIAQIKEQEAQLVASAIKEQEAVIKVEMAKGKSASEAREFSNKATAERLLQIGKITAEEMASAEAWKNTRTQIDLNREAEKALATLQSDADAGRLAAAKEHLKIVVAAGNASEITAANALVEAAGRKDANDELKKAETSLARVAGSYQDQVAALIEERGYQTDVEKSLAAQIVATRMLAEDTKRLDQEEKNRKNTIEQIFEREREALANLGKSQAQLNVLKLQAAGATEKEVAAFQALADKHDRDAKALSDREKEQQDAKSLLESAMTKEEKLAEKIAQVRRFEADQIYTKEQAQKVMNSLVEKENKLRNETVGMYSDGLSLVRAMSAAGLADEKTGRAGGRFGGVVPVPVPAPMPPAPDGLPGVVNSVMDRIATLNEGILAILSRWDTDGIKIKSLPPITATYA
jgi:hypothetical protein